MNFDKVFLGKADIFLNQENFATRNWKSQQEKCKWQLNSKTSTNAFKKMDEKMKYFISNKFGTK